MQPVKKHDELTRTVDGKVNRIIELPTPWVPSAAAVPEAGAAVIACYLKPSTVAAAEPRPA